MIMFFLIMLFSVPFHKVITKENSAGVKNPSAVSYNSSVTEKSFISDVPELFHTLDSKLVVSGLSTSFDKLPLSASETFNLKANNRVHKITNEMKSKQTGEDQNISYSVAFNQSSLIEHLRTLNNGINTKEEPKHKISDVKKNIIYGSKRGVEKKLASTILLSGSSNNYTDQSNNQVINDNKEQLQIKLNKSDYHNEHSERVSTRSEHTENYNAYKVELNKTSDRRLVSSANAVNETFLQSKNSSNKFSSQGINYQNRRNSKVTNGKSVVTVSILEKNQYYSINSSSRYIVITESIVQAENSPSNPDHSINVNEEEVKHSKPSSSAAEWLLDATVLNADQDNKEVVREENKNFSVYNDSLVDEGHKKQKQNFSEAAPEKHVLFPKQDDPHFFFYFLSFVVIVIVCYLIFHNKQKIIALIVEGCHERRRRPHGINYRKLETK